MQHMLHGIWDEGSKRELRRKRTSNYCRYRLECGNFSESK